MARNEVDSSTLPKDNSLVFDPKTGFVGGGVVETDAVRMSKDDIDNEAFSRETVVIKLHRQPGKGAYEIVPVGVGEDMRWVKVGVATPVKRYHVEALLHARTTQFDQAPMESAYADVPELKPSTTYTFPFEVVKDTPEGHAWRARIMERQA